MNGVTGCGWWGDINVFHAARLQFDPGDLARVAHRGVQVAALARQAVRSIGHARPGVDEDRAHVVSVQVQHFDFVRHTPRRDVGGLFVGADDERMEVDTNRSVARV